MIYGIHSMIEANLAIFLNPETAGFHGTVFVEFDYLMFSFVGHPHSRVEQNWVNAGVSYTFRSRVLMHTRDDMYCTCRF